MDLPVTDSEQKRRLHTTIKYILLFVYSYKAREAFLPPKNNLDGLEELKGQFKRSKPPI